VDAIVEYIQGRRRKSGWGIWDVTLSLGEVLQKVSTHVEPLSSPGTRAEFRW
jgi:hypothetical protein